MPAQTRPFIQFIRPFASFASNNQLPSRVCSFRLQSDETRNTKKKKGRAPTSLSPLGQGVQLYSGAQNRTTSSSRFDDFHSLDQITSRECQARAYSWVGIYAAQPNASHHQGTRKNCTFEVMQSSSSSSFGERCFFFEFNVLRVGNCRVRKEK